MLVARSDGAPPPPVPGRRSSRLEARRAEVGDERAAVRGLHTQDVLAAGRRGRAGVRPRLGADGRGLRARGAGADDGGGGDGGQCGGADDREHEALLGGRMDDDTDATEGPETWSPYVIVGHLIHGERADWIPRARIILAQGPQRHFTPYDRFAQFRESEGKSLTDLLDDLTHLRAENLATLAGWRLTDAQLSLKGEHPEFGPVTLGQLLATWVAHDLGHVAQTARVMAKQYETEIGPWKKYFSVFGGR